MSGIFNKMFEKKPKKKYKNVKGNNSTRVPLKYSEIEEKIKKLREEKNGTSNNNVLGS